MASFHLCNTINADTYRSYQPSLRPLKASKGICASTAPTSYKLGKQVSGSNKLSIINHIDNSTEPMVSSGTLEFPLKIGIIGLGEFGQFLAKAFKRQGHNVLGTSRSDYSQYCQENGIGFCRHLNDMCEAQPDVILVCSSILSTEDVVRGIPFNKLKPNTIIADVLSVKQFPMNLFLDIVPPGFGILCTHPMFGKFSGKNSWEGLRFVYDKVRVSENSVQEQNCELFLDIFRDEGCKMVEMSCEEHDRYAAESQFVTHTITRVLAQMDLEATPIDTKGYEILRELTQNTTSHSSDLYHGLYLYNVNATQQIEKLEKAFETVKQSLFDKLRDTLRKKIQEPAVVGQESEAMHSSHFLPASANVKDLSSFSVIPNVGETQEASATDRNEVHHATL